MNVENFPCRKTDTSTNTLVIEDLFDTEFNVTRAYKSNAWKNCCKATFQFTSRWLMPQLQIKANLIDLFGNSVWSDPYLPQIPNPVSQFQYSFMDDYGSYSNTAYCYHHGYNHHWSHSPCYFFLSSCESQILQKVCFYLSKIDGFGWIPQTCTNKALELLNGGPFEINKGQKSNNIYVMKFMIKCWKFPFQKIVTSKNAMVVEDLFDAEFDVTRF